MIDGKWACLLNLSIDPNRPELKENLAGIQYTSSTYFEMAAVSTKWATNDFTPAEFEELRFVKPITHAPDGRVLVPTPATATTAAAPTNDQHTLADGWYRLPDGLCHALRIADEWVMFTNGSGGFKFCDDLTKIPGQEGQTFWRTQKQFFGKLGHLDARKAADFVKVFNIRQGWHDLTGLKNGWYQMPAPYSSWYGRMLDGHWGNIQKLGTDQATIEAGTPAKLAKVNGIGVGPIEGCGFKGFANWKTEDFKFAREITHNYDGNPLKKDAPETTTNQPTPEEPKIKLHEAPDPWKTIEGSPCLEIKADPQQNSERDNSVLWLAVPAAGLLLSGFLAAGKGLAKKKVQQMSELAVVKG